MRPTLKDFFLIKPDLRFNITKGLYFPRTTSSEVNIPEKYKVPKEIGIKRIREVSPVDYALNCTKIEKFKKVFGDYYAISGDNKDPEITKLRKKLRRYKKRHLNFIRPQNNVKVSDTPLGDIVQIILTGLNKPREKRTVVKKRRKKLKKEKEKKRKDCDNRKKERKLLENEKEKIREKKKRLREFKLKEKKEKFKNKTMNFWSKLEVKETEAYLAREAEFFHIMRKQAEDICKGTTENPLDIIFGEEVLSKYKIWLYKQPWLNIETRKVHIVYKKNIKDDL